MTCNEISIIEQVNQISITEQNCEIIISSVGSQGPAGGGGGGSIDSITSVDGSVIITTPSVGVKDLSVAIGSVSVLTAQVRNQTGATLTKGTLVYISGAAGNKCLVSKAQANSESTSSKTFGMIQNDISNNQNGFVVISGIISGLDTSAYVDGTTLYLSPSVAGNYTSTKPVAPNHTVYVGTITRQHANQGEIQVRIQNGYELDEIHDVLIASPANNQILTYDSGLWKNLSLQASQINNALGYTPASNQQSIVNALIFG